MSSSGWSKGSGLRLAFVRRPRRLRGPELRSVGTRWERRAAAAVRRMLTRARSNMVGERFFGVVGAGSDRSGVAGGSAAGGGDVGGEGGAETASFTTACVTTELSEVAEVAAPTKRGRMYSLWSPDPRNAILYEEAL